MMSAIESTTSSPFGISYIASKRANESSDKTGEITSSAISARNLSHNKWATATASNGTKTNLYTSYSLGSEISLKNNAKQLSPQSSFIVNGTTKPRSASFENAANGEVAAGRPVLKRWPPTCSSPSDEDKSLVKNRKPIVQQGGADKFKFKPVASLLSRTPWQKDFVKRSNSFKRHSGDSTTSVPSSSQDSSSRSSREIEDDDLGSLNHEDKEESLLLSNGHAELNRTNTSTSVTLNGSLSYDQITRNHRNHTEENPRDQSHKRPTSLKINGFYQPVADSTCSPNDCNGQGIEVRRSAQPSYVNGTAHSPREKVFIQSLVSPDIWIKRRTQELQGEKSPQREQVTLQENHTTQASRTNFRRTGTSPEEEESDMAYSGRSYYSSPRTSTYKSSTPSFDTGYRPSTRTRLGSPERSRTRYTSPERSRNRTSSPERSYRGSTLDYGSSSRYTSSSVYASSSSYSRTSFDSGDDIYRSRASSTRTYQTSNGRDLSTSSSLYKSDSRNSYSSSQSQSYRSYKLDSYDKDITSSSSRSLDIATYDSRTYESRKYAGSSNRASDVDIATSATLAGKGSAVSDKYAKGRYSLALSRQDSLGYDIGDETGSYSPRYSSYSAKSSLKSPDTDEFSTSSARSYYSTSFDAKSTKSGEIETKESNVITSYGPRSSGARRFSDDVTHSVKSNPDGFEKSSFIRRSLRLGKTREKSEEREVDDQSLGRLSRLRSSLKWSHSKDKEDEPRKEKSDDVKKETSTATSFLKRSPKKKGKEAGEGASGSRPTSPTSDPDRGLSPEPSGEFSPTTRKRLDEKKDKVSFFKRFRKTSKGHEESLVSPTDVDHDGVLTSEVEHESVRDKPEADNGSSNLASGDVESCETSAASRKKEALAEEGTAKDVKSEVSSQLPPLAEPETDFDDLDMWSKSIEKDICSLNSAIKDIKDQEMGNAVSSAVEETKDQVSQASTISRPESVKIQLVKEPTERLKTQAYKENRNAYSEDTKEDSEACVVPLSYKEMTARKRSLSEPVKMGSRERLLESSSKVDDTELLKSLNAPAKLLPKQEDVLGSDTEVISSLEMESPVSTPEDAPKTTGLADSYVIVDKTVEGRLSEKKKNGTEGGSEGNICKPAEQQEPGKDSQKEASSSSGCTRSRFVRTHGSAKERIREKKLRREQEEQMRALAAAREETRLVEETEAEEAKEDPHILSNPPNQSETLATSTVTTVTLESEGQKTIHKTTSISQEVEETTLPPPGVVDPNARSPKGKRRILRRSRTLVNLPPHIPEPEVTRVTQDDAAVVKREKKIIRPRPRTLTQGIDPSVIFAQGKPEGEESGVVEEKQLSLKQLQMKFLSGNFENKSSAAEKKEKAKEEKKSKVKRSRSGKRYKTITEGIAPGILDAARHLSDQASDVEEKNLQNEELSRLTAALSASTQDIKRQSYLVGENGSVPNSKSGSLATSVEDLSKGTQLPKDDPFSILRKPLAEVNRSASEESDVPSLSALKERFLKAVVETEAKHKQKRKKSSIKERPHTICGLDDWTFQQIQGTMGETERDTRSHGPVKSESLEIEEHELEEICKLEGLSPEELAAELGVDPSLNATSYENQVHKRNSKALEDLRRQQREMVKEPSPPPPEPGVPKWRRSADSSMLVVEDTTKKRRSGVFEPADITGLTSSEEPVKAKEQAKPVLDGTESDLDFVSMQSSQLSDITAGKRHLKPQRKHRTGANPVKALSKREDLVDESEASEKKQEEDKPLTSDSASPYRGGSGLSQRSVGQKLWRKVALANEAKSALMSVEDFSTVKLRKVKSAEERKKDEIESFQGSKVSNILIHVKGRRHVQSRVVDFSVSSFNSGDSFVIVTPTSIHCWHGKQANVIEKAKAAEIGSRIQQKKEMGCKALDVVYYEQGGPGEERVFRPFELETVPKIPPSDVLMLDEDYEKNMILSNMVYTVQTSDPPELVPFLEMCHKMPSKEILKTDEAFVFDFISEVYVWIGRQTTSVLRKTIQQLAKTRFDMGYFRPSAVSSYAHLHGRARKISLKTEAGPHCRKGSSSRRVSLQKQLQDKENIAPRPPHSIILVMFEGAEWVIFREKFSDWPDESRIIRMKGGPQARGEAVKTPVQVDVKVLDPTVVLESKVKPQTFVFEGTAIERGQGRPNLGIEGYHIVTKEVNIWFVTEQKHYLLPPESLGQFHSGEGYVIRWEYSVVPERVMRTLSDKSQAKNMGRQKCVYFFWLGNDCSVTEQAATAVMTVELDKEKGPQVRVLQGKEPPCLLNIFNGGMIIHAGKRPIPGVRKNFTDRSLIRLYCVRNELPNEACLLQVPVSSDSLRSRSSYVLVLCGQGEIFVWHGCKCSESTRTTALQAARKLVEQHPAEAALADKTEIGINILEEGHEPEVFWVALGGEEDYGSLLLDVNTNWDFTPRLFQLSTATGEFMAHEVACPSISDQYYCPFPFLQDDLYNSDQPSIFLLDAHSEVYLWLGWWPDDEEAEVTSSMYTRWDIEKRKAMESALAYSKAAGRSLTRTYVVYAGLEPDSFIWLFPYWVVQEDITDIQIEEGREQEEKILITEELEMFSKDTYTIEELRVRPPPQGVNPTRLETYLSDEDFKTLFEMDREQFLQLPTWKKANIKKKVGLY